MKTNILLFRNIFLLVLTSLMSISLMAQEVIYQQNFDNVNSGMLPTNGSNQDGWLVNGTTSELFDGNGNVGHRMGIHSGGQAISGKSLGISFYKTYNGTF